MSRDHHQALVVARRCLRAVADESEALVAQTWDATCATFQVDLEPHFSLEERLLLLPLAEAGETELVERTRREHARLRKLAKLGVDREVVREFGELLAAHVRFEEQVLFPCVERLLSATTLAAVAKASAALATAQGRAFVDAGDQANERTSA